MVPELRAPVVTRLHARAPLLPLAAALLAALAWGPFAPVARAQLVKPWAPAGDTLTAMASSAKLRFQRQVGDTVGGDNLDAYTIVSKLARGLLAQLGRAHAAQARAIEPTLDSLGLDVQVATDPKLSLFVFMLVRNPYRPSSDAVGFLYWFRGKSLEVQGVSFPPGRDPVFRVWRSGMTGAPYDGMVVYQRLGRAPAPCFRLLRMDAGGYFWNLVQYELNGPQFDPGTSLQFVDVNLDEKPEILAMRPVEPDSFLALRTGVPRPYELMLYTERPEGFVLHEARPVGGPVETLRLFTRFLVGRDYDRARRLLLEPARLDSALALGWGRYTSRGAFLVEYGEPDQAWPEWFELRVRDDSGSKRWIFHFTISDGRWVIRDWIPVQPRTPAAGAPADTSRGAGP